MSGRVSFYYNGQWGTVCDDLFDQSNNGCMVVCRQLGFTWVVCIFPIHFLLISRKSGSEMYLMAKMFMLIGSEANLNACTHFSPYRRINHFHLISFCDSYGVHINHCGQGSGPIWLDTVICTGSEANLDACSHSPYGIHDCDHFEDAACRCCNNNSHCDNLGCWFRSRICGKGLLGLNGLLRRSLAGFKTPFLTSVFVPGYVYGQFSA